MPRDGTANLIPLTKGHGGRPKGSKNKVVQAMRELYRQALEEVGGVEYLKKLARKHPEVFAQGLHRMIPEKREDEQTIKIVFRHPDVLVSGRVGANEARALSERMAAEGRLIEDKPAEADQ